MEWGLGCLGSVLGVVVLGCFGWFMWLSHTVGVLRNHMWPLLVFVGFLVASFCSCAWFWVWGWLVGVVFGCWIVDASIAAGLVCCFLVCGVCCVFVVLFCVFVVCCFCWVFVWQALLGTWWMPWHQEPMKDVRACDKPWGVGNGALIRGCPNGGT